MPIRIRPPPRLARQDARHQRPSRHNRGVGIVVQVVGLGGGQLAHGEVVQDQGGGAGQLAEPFVPGAVGVPAGQVGQCPAGFHEPGVGAGPDGQVGEGLADVAFAYPDRPVQDDRFAGLQPAQGGQVADLGGGKFRGCAEVKAFEGGGGLEPGSADPALQGGGFPAGDLVLAQDLQEVQVAEFPGVRLGQAGVEGVQHAGQFQVAQGCGQGAAVGDGNCGGHGAASVMAVKMRTWCPASWPSAMIQPRVGPGRVSRAAWPPAAAASSVTAAVRLAGPAR